MRKGLFSILVVALLCVVLVSCASSAKKTGSDTEEVINVEQETVQEVPAGTLALDFSDEDSTNWLSALGDIRGLDIKSYQLRGEGPDGAKFDWIEVTGTKVALSDVRRGHWTLYARAIGENGEILATGQLETFLSDSSPMGAVYLDSEVGQGNARCSFAWNTFQVLYPSIEIYVKKGDGEYIARDPSEISIGDGVAVWNAHDLGAGSYIVRAILKDEGEVVSGVAAAMRIIDTKLSVGDVRFIVGKLSTVYGISLMNSPVATIRGDLKLNGTTVGYESESTGLSYDWFLNGEYVSEYGEQSIDMGSRGLGKGFYRIDCIVQDSSDTSINSASMLVYVDGETVKQVTEEEADGAKDSAPEGYDEVVTNSELPIEIAKGHVQDPVEQETEAEETEAVQSGEPEEMAEAENVSPEDDEVVETDYDEPIYFIYGDE